jgi:predicted DNA binding CopG/RHH family protein
MTRGKKGRLNLRLKESLLEDIKQMAKKKELTVTAFVEITLRVTIQQLKAQEHLDAESV